MISRRTCLAALLPVSAAGVTGTKTKTMETPTDEQTAAVSFEIASEEIANPPAVTISVDDFGDADAVRVIQPDSVPAIRTIARDGADYLVLELDLTAGILVESVHGDWRTTVAKRWLVKDDGELAVSSEQPSLEEGAAWMVEENREVPREDTSE